MLWSLFWTKKKKRCWAGFHFPGFSENSSPRSSVVWLLNVGAPVAICCLLGGLPHGDLRLQVSPFRSMSTQLGGFKCQSVIGCSGVPPTARWRPIFNWVVHGDEQVSKGWPFSILNDEQVSNKLGVEPPPVKNFQFSNTLKISSSNLPNTSESFVPLCSKFWKNLDNFIIVQNFKTSTAFTMLPEPFRSEKLPARDPFKM